MESVLDKPMVIANLFLCAELIFLAYVFTKFLPQEHQRAPRKGRGKGYKIKDEKVPARPSEKKKESAAGKSKKKPEPRWNSRGDKQTFNHPWLLTSLKGHTGRVLDMDFASNGKYLASVGDEDLEEDPGSTTIESSSSSSECNKENSRPASPEPSPRPQPSLSRRQRKNRRRESDAKKRIKSLSKSSRKDSFSMNVPPLEDPLNKFSEVTISDHVFAHLLKRTYVLRSEDMAKLGYPTLPNKRAMISQNVFLICNEHFHYEPNRQHFFDINAKEFVPKSDSTSDSTSDSGQGSGSSSEEESCSSFYDVTTRYHIPMYERVCVRCGSWFYTTHNKYMSWDSCRYHWGKLQTQESGCGPLEYTCCKGSSDSIGCSQAKLHVWNGPGEIAVRFTETKPLSKHPPNGNYGVYSLDCEMSYTVAGLEVTKVTLVGVDGKVAYNAYVRPTNEIVDYNTRFSGITEEDFKTHGSKSLTRVQKDLKQIINSSTVLIGHGLENDLKALRLIHKTVVDTSFTFPHFKGLPYKRSLRSLVKSCLKRDIQCGEKGHDSYEDARACMDLMWYRLKRDFGIES